MPLDFDSWKENLAQQQAQLWAGLRAIEAQQAETARRSEEDRQNIARLVDVCMSLTNHVESLKSQSQETDRRLRESGEETDRRLRELSEETHRRFRELREAQAHTDNRLNILVDTVDKLVKRN
jgi:chromosome segregation ATPase